MNKLIFSILLAVSIPSITIAQNTSWSIGTQLTSKKYLADEQFLTLDDHFQYIVNFNGSNPAYGIVIMKSFKDFEIIAGAQLSKVLFSSIINCLKCDGIAIDAIPQDFNSNSILIPLITKYKLGKRSVKPFLQVGFINQIRTKSEFLDSRNYAALGQIGLGIDYSITSSIVMGLSYNKSKFLSDYFESKEINSRKLSIDELQIQLAYGFHKNH